MDDVLADLRKRVDELERAYRGPRAEPDALYTAGEIAGKLRCGKTTVYDLLAGGEIAVIRVGAGHGGLRVRASDLDAFLDARREGGPKPRTAFRHLKV